MCFLWFHKWNNWKDIGTSGPRWNRNLFSESLDWYRLYTRNCERCGDFQTKEINDKILQQQVENEFKIELLKMKARMDGLNA